jgi:hypothetical protein
MHSMSTAVDAGCARFVPDLPSCANHAWLGIAILLAGCKPWRLSYCQGHSRYDAHSATHVHLGRWATEKAPQHARHLLAVFLVEGL